MVCLWWALQARWRLGFRSSRELPEQADLHFQHILPSLLLQPLVQLIGVPLTEPTETKKESLLSHGYSHMSADRQFLCLLCRWVSFIKHLSCGDLWECKVTHRETDMPQMLPLTILFGQPVQGLCSTLLSMRKDLSPSSLRKVCNSQTRGIKPPLYCA